MSQTIIVEEMACGHCEQTVEEAIQDIEGVDDVTADNESGLAVVKGSANTESLVSAVEEAGYETSAEDE